MNGARKTRTYGTKSKKGGLSAAAAAIFGESHSVESSPRRSPRLLKHLRDPLEDITRAAANLTINSDDEGSSVSDLVSEAENDITDIKSITPEPEFTQWKSLQPLKDTYFVDCSQNLETRSWAEVISSSTIEKIAEASYAEVYRLTNELGSSIMKIQRLNLPEQPESQEQENSSKIEDVISELRIMNALTVIPGFVTFKDAHLIQGKPLWPIATAWYKFRDESEEGASYFPSPDEYPEDAIFLVIELGDAGQVLECTPIDTIDQLWDVLLGVIIAISRAEHEFEFEHRDLHENNICINNTGKRAARAKALKAHNPDLKLGFSDLDVTIIDYGLSSATLSNDDRIFFDLETDPDIFRGAARNLQFNTYRRMRTHLFSENSSETKLRRWQTPPSKRRGDDSHTWAEFIPYTNVLWLKYLLAHLVKEHGASPQADAATLQAFKTDTRELNRRLNPNTKWENGAFADMRQVLAFVVDQGWVDELQIVEYGAEAEEEDDEGIDE